MHEHNIMHRDLKLENIMIKQGILKIVDFGFAKIFKKDQQLSM
jgi:serine/threonine protein kinase